MKLFYGILCCESILYYAFLFLFFPKNYIEKQKLNQALRLLIKLNIIPLLTNVREIFCAFVSPNFCCWFAFILYSLSMYIVQCIHVSKQHYVFIFPDRNFLYFTPFFTFFKLHFKWWIGMSGKLVYWITEWSMC